MNESWALEGDTRKKSEIFLGDTQRKKHKTFYIRRNRKHSIISQVELNKVAL